MKENERQESFRRPQRKRKRKIGNEISRQFSPFFSFIFGQASDSCLYIFLKENVFTWAWMSALVCPSGRADAHVNVGQAIGKCSKSLELWAFETIAFIRTSTEVPIVSLLRPTISSWDTNRLSNLLFDLLLREKRLQAIKEKPSLASSSFCWPFLFFINGPTGRWQQPMMGIQGKITIIFFLFIVLLQENNKMKEKMIWSWIFDPWIHWWADGLMPDSGSAFTVGPDGHADPLLVGHLFHGASIFPWPWALDRSPIYDLRVIRTRSITLSAHI